VRGPPGVPVVGRGGARLSVHGKKPSLRVSANVNVNPEYEYAALVV
jgi:hypothetical protein